MMVELNSEQEQILESAKRSGKSQEEVLNRVFQILREEQEMDEWMLANREEIAAQIEEGCAQAERGELIDAEKVVQILCGDRMARRLA